jgi:4-amino-4-deoxy-L-arabinose transferase-like glycosyltransferase
MKPSERERTRAADLSLVGIGSLALFGWAARGPDYYNFDEGVYAEVAREIARTGQLLTPRCNGVPYFEKPPLVYWLSALSYRLFGTATWAGRLPVVLFGAIGVMALYWLIALWRNRAAALAASVCLATSFGYFIYARTLMMDAPLTALFVVAMAAFFSAWQRPERTRPMLALTAATLGLAVMVKGLIGIALPALAAAVAGIFSADLRAFLKRIGWSGAIMMTAIFVTVAAPWHLLVEIRYPHVMAHYLVAGQLRRYMQGADSLDVVPLGVGAYLGATTVWFLPWAIFLPPAIAIALRDIRRRAPEHDLLVAALAWSFTAVAFFLVSPARLEYYALPALPGFAILVGYWWSRVELPSLAARNCFAAMLIVAALGWVVALASAHLPIIDRLYAVLNEQYRNASGAVQPSLKELTPAVIVELITLTGAGCLGLIAAWRKHKRVAFAGMLALAIVSIWAVHRGLEVMEPYCSVAPLARGVAKTITPADAVVIMGPFEAASPIAFYLRRPVMIVDGLGGDLREGREIDSTASRYFLDDASFRQLWTKSGRRVYLVIVNGDPVADPPPPAPAWRIQELPSGAVYSNRP